MSNETTRKLAAQLVADKQEVERELYRANLAVIHTTARECNEGGWMVNEDDERGLALAATIMECEAWLETTQNLRNYGVSVLKEYRSTADQQGLPVAGLDLYIANAEENRARRRAEREEARRREAQHGNEFRVPLAVVAHMKEGRL